LKDNENQDKQRKHQNAFEVPKANKILIKMLLEIKMLLKQAIKPNQTKPNQSKPNAYTKMF